MPLQNSQYDAIMRTYAARRIRHRNELEQRLALIHQQIPFLAALETELTAASAEAVRAAVEGDPAVCAAAKDKKHRLAAQKKEALLSHGFSPEDCELSYDCPLCRDTGYVNGERCHCLKQAIIRQLYNQSHLNLILEKENFDTFTYSYYDKDDVPAVRRAVMDSQLFIDSFDREFRNLLFLGATGTGKTFLCNCIAKELLERCCSVIYLTAFELFDLLANAHFDKGADAQLYQMSGSYIFDCDLLIIDDLGTELNNSFVSSQLFLCINERILKQKSTIISSNLSLAALRDAYSERTLSRITSSYTIWQLPGSDIRIKKKLSGKN